MNIFQIKNKIKPYIRRNPNLPVAHKAIQLSRILWVGSSLLLTMPLMTIYKKLHELMVHKKLPACKKFTDKKVVLIIYGYLMKSCCLNKYKVVVLFRSG